MAWTQEEREGVKEELWPLVHNPDLPIDERARAACGIIEAWWNESYERYYDAGWREPHPTYKQYAAGILAQSDRFPGDVTHFLQHHFGTNPDLLSSGTIFWSPPSVKEKE